MGFFWFTFSNWLAFSCFLILIVSVTVDPQRFAYGGVDGYQLFVGDIPSDWTEDIIRGQLQNRSASCIYDWFSDIVGLRLQFGGAASGAGRAVITFRTADACRCCKDSIYDWYTPSSDPQGWRYLQIRFTTQP